MAPKKQPIHFSKLHIDSISHFKSDGNNISLKYFNAPIELKTDIVTFDSGIYKDTRDRYVTDIQISPELHQFLLMLEARAEKYAAKYNLKFLRMIRKDSQDLTLKILSNNRRILAKIFKEGDPADTTVVAPGRGAELTLSLKNMWIMNNDISGLLLTIQRIDMAHTI